MRGFFAAIRFLTIIPVPGKIGTGKDDLAGSLAFFPLVGLLIGALTGGVFYLAGPYLPLPLLVVLVVFMLMGFSGGLHLDGVADCADGFFSSRPREKMLEIMRDSRIGTMGVAGIFLIFSLKGAALMSLPLAELWPLLVLMPIAGRCSMPIMMAVLPYARKEGGLASVFYERDAVLEAIWAVGLFLVFSWLLVGIIGFLLAPVIIVVILAFCFYCKRRIGGATGDTLGAVCEISEAALAVFYVSLMFVLSAG
ncbi:MAG: adenosylcobinamide-GDP ribazoletransferase [Thermodesulfobacteriota bacterium]